MPSMSSRRAFLKSAPLAAAAFSLPIAGYTESVVRKTSDECRTHLVSALSTLLQQITGTEWDVQNDRKLGALVMIDTYKRKQA